MSFNDIKRNTAAKVIVLVLCIAGLGTALLGGLVSVYGYMHEYSTLAVDFTDTHGYRAAVDERTWRIEEHFFEWVNVTPDEVTARYYSENEGNEYFNRENFGMGFEIYEVTKAEADNSEQEAAEVNEESGEAAENANGEQAAEDVDDTQYKLLYSNYMPDVIAGEGQIHESNKYLIKYYVDGRYLAKDTIYWERQMYEFISSKYRMFTIAGIAGFAVFLITIIFLILAAGYRRDRDEITLNLLDRIHYDLVFVTCASVVGICMVVTAMCYDSASLANAQIFRLFTLADGGKWAFTIPVIVLVIIMSMMITAFILTSAARFKKGGWWRNTVIYHLIRLCVKFIRWTFNASKRVISTLPLVWKTASVSAFALFTILTLAYTSHPLGILLSFALSIVLFAGIIYCSMSMRKLQKAARELASGNDEYRVDTEKLIMDFKEHGDNLNSIGEGINLAVQQRMKSERLKTELITNVSHDIKTPLTSIINYVDLLEKQNLDGEAEKYVQIIKRQSARLKKLTQDVLDASKASTGNIEVNLVDTDILEIVNQAAAEYRERLGEKNLELVIKNESGAEILVASADGRLLWRSMDNLMSNICKYSLEGSRVYINAGFMNGNPSITFKNVSRNELDISADELMERFVRGDSSRSTEGSGLGLSIARSLIEAQGGTLTISIDGDLFRADIELKRY